MALRNPLIVQAFATAGDRTLPPVTAQPNGAVSFNQGWPALYQANPDTEPNARPVERDVMNALFYAATANIRQYQLEGAPEFIAAADNGGVPVAYPFGSSVVWRPTEADPFRVYVNTVPANTNSPASPSNGWVEMNVGGFNGFEALSGSGGTLTRDQCGKQLTITGVGSPAVASWSMPATANLSNGATINIYVAAGSTITLNTSGGILMIGNATVGGGTSSLILQQQTRLQLVWTGGYWLASGGSSGNLVANGYVRLDNGLLMQWGTGTLPNSGVNTSTVAVAFPVSFPNGAPFGVLLTARSTMTTGGFRPIMQADLLTGSGFTAVGDSNNAGLSFNKTCQFNWIAFGN